MWSLAYEELQSFGDKNHLSRLVGAKLVANRIMTTNFKASQIADIAQSEMGIMIPWPNQAIESLQKFVEEVRKWNRPTQDRLRSLAEFKQALTESLDLWELVETALLQQWFIWPLLILEDKANKETALSIPLMLNLSSKAERIKNSNRLSPNEDFLDSIEQAEEAAIGLWKYKHMSWPEECIEQVESLKISIDLTVSESIIAPYSNFLSEDITLKEKKRGSIFLTRYAIQTGRSYGTGGRLQHRNHW